MFQLNVYCLKIHINILQFVYELGSYHSLVVFQSGNVAIFSSLLYRFFQKEPPTRLAKAAVDNFVLKRQFGVSDFKDLFKVVPNSQKKISANVTTEIHVN